MDTSQEFLFESWKHQTTLVNAMMDGTYQIEVVRRLPRKRPVRRKMKSAAEFLSYCSQ